MKRGREKYKKTGQKVRQNKIEKEREEKQEMQEKGKEKEKE